MKKLWFPNICIILAGLLGTVNVFLGHIVVQQVIIYVFVAAIFSLARYPKFMADCYGAHIDEVCSSANCQSIDNQLATGGLYTIFSGLFLIGCGVAAVGSIWINRSAITSMTVVFVPIIVGVILSLYFDRKTPRASDAQKTHC